MRTIFLIFLSLLIMAISFSTKAEDGIAEVFGDWTELCEESATSGKLCNISQTLTRPNSTDILLSISINYLEGSDEPVVFAILPLGGLLAYPPQLKVGLEKPVDMAYQFCDVSGCTAAAVLNKDVLASLHKEIQAIVKFVNRERKAIGIPVSLIGFSKGLKKIAPAGNTAN